MSTQNTKISRFQRGVMSEGELLNFEMRSCVIKKRYSLEPTCTLNQYAYHCAFCQGWHKATKRSDD